MIIPLLVANYTNIEEESREIGSTDDFAHCDQRTWLNYRSYMYIEDNTRDEKELQKEGRRIIRELAESNNRPKSGYNDIFLCGICKEKGQTNPRKCYEELDPEDTQHSPGDVMRAHTTDQSILETN